MKILTRFLGLVLLLAVAGLAQDITGSIAGTVTDPSGAGVPNAKVTVTNTDRNAVLRTVATDQGGNYSAPLLPIGTYALDIAAAGSREVTLTVQPPATIPLKIIRSGGPVAGKVTLEQPKAQGSQPAESTPRGLEARNASSTPPPRKSGMTAVNGSPFSYKAILTFCAYGDSGCS